MTDPERISKRSTGLSAHLLQAAAAEQPNPAGIEKTLSALGVSGVVLSAATATSAAASGAKLTTVTAVGGGASGAGIAGGTAKAVSATLLVKWIGIGVIGGVGLAGAAAVVSAPAKAPQSIVQAASPAPRVVAPAPAAVVAQPAQPSVAEEPVVEAAPVVTPPPARPSVALPTPAPDEADVGVPLAAEVAFVDHARSLLAAGQSEQGLATLQGYERQFPEARLLPEVLFLRLETCERLGRNAEARAAAQQLVDGFPKSPHAARARKLLGS